MLKFYVLYVMDKALSGKLSCMGTGLFRNAVLTRSLKVKRVFFQGKQLYFLAFFLRGVNSQKHLKDMAEKHRGVPVPSSLL